jgi:serine/threonine protein kinase
MAEDQHVEREHVAVSTGITKQERRGGRVTSADQAAAVSGDDRSEIGAGATKGAAASAEVAPPRDVLAEGTKVGRYEVIRLIGEGGMGTVYEALDARLNRKVALKILSSALKSKRKAAKRFTIEAQAAARLEHPNVVGIFDFDVECEIPYMAMELLQGETLAAAIDRGPLAFARVANIMLAVCAGVHAAHQAGIVHRDLKPSNIFLCPDWKGNETARVLDFGISKVGGISSSGLTQTGDIVGTSQYLSPEQAAGLRHVTEQSDQYSLGVVMYECVTQQTPQRGLPIYSLLRNVTEGRHAPPRELRPDLPPAFEAVIERAMSVRPKDRYPSVLYLGRALFPLASAEGQRQFDDFYNRAEADTKWPESPGWHSQRADADGRAVATQPLPRKPTPTWQQRTTHTSARSSKRDSRSGPVAPSPSRRPRTLLYLIALCAALAVAALVVFGLAARP